MSWLLRLFSPRRPFYVVRWSKSYKCDGERISVDIEISSHTGGGNYTIGDLLEIARDHGELALAAFAKSSQESKS